MPRPKRPVQEFTAKVMSILPDIVKGKDKKQRVRGQDKWGFQLQITKGPRKGEIMSIWGHCMRPAKQAGIGKIKIGDRLLITIKNHRNWSWEPVAKSKAKSKKRKA